MWGWGAMNPTAVKEAAKINFPMDKFSRHLVVRRRGRRARAAAPGQGLSSRSTSMRRAPNFPAIQDIKKHVVDKGRQGYPKDKVGENLYNRGVFNSVLIAEAIRNAQKLTGKKVVTGEDVRRGLESLKHHRGAPEGARARGLRRAAEAPCADHNGHHAAFMQQWDGTKWVKVSDWIEPMKDKVQPMLEAAAKDYAEKNAGWPKRTEPCDKAS